MRMAKLVWNKPVLAVDASYAVFHRFFALRRWERMSGQRSCEPDCSMSSEKELIAFGDSFKSMLVNHMRTHGVLPTNTILMLDCPRSEIWRRDLLPSYKESRPVPNDFSPNIFAFFRESVVPELVSGLGVQAVGFARAEADDVAGAIAKMAAEQEHCDLTILTGDCDLAQLEIPGKIKVVDMKGESLLAKATKKVGCCNDAETYLAIKILQGDRGDNIPPARERLGPKTALRMSLDQGLLDAFLSNPENRCRYELNRDLIDISRMPVDIANGLCSALAAIVE